MSLLSILALCFLLYNIYNHYINNLFSYHLLLSLERKLHMVRLYFFYCCSSYAKPIACLVVGA